MDFNPFDALGLKPQESYSKKDLDTARKTALKRVHPDHRPPDFSERWPSLENINAAATFLEDKENCEEAFEYFKLFPRTFFPDDPYGSYFDTRSVQAPFGLCSICQTALPESAISQHIQRTHESSHKPDEKPLEIQECPFCNKPFAENHFSTVHCSPSCCDQPRDNLDLVDHINSHHWTECFLCDVCIYHTAMPFHLSTAHNWQPCAECQPEQIEFSEHLYNSHSPDECPICKTIVLEVWSHLSDYHSFRYCQDCPSDADLLNNHFTQAHFMDECPYCHRLVPIDDIDHHFIQKHSHKQCPHCERVEHPQAYQEHIDEDHKLQNCEYCYKQIPQDSIPLHRVIQHGWIPCPFCDTMVQEQPEMREHLQQSHNDTDCPVCRTSVHSSALQDHLRFQHKWKQCHHCSKAFPEPELQQHLQSHEQKQCLVCSQTLAQNELGSHMSQHETIPCPVCHDEIGNLSEHFAEKHPTPQRTVKEQAICQDAQEIFSLLQKELTNLSRNFAEKYPPSRDNQESLSVLPEERNPSHHPAEIHSTSQDNQEAVKMVSEERRTVAGGEDADRPAACGECGQMLTMNTIREHIRLDHERAPAICKQCGEGYTQQTIQGHITNKHAQRRYKTHRTACTQCSRLVSTKKMKRHLETCIRAHTKAPHSTSDNMLDLDQTIANSSN